MEYVTSADGTRIAYERAGSGPPLVLVHGTASDASVWDDVTPRFGEQFTVYAMERRGRGESGDADGYALEREFEDVEALAASLEGPVTLVGHSFGGVCAFGAAPRLSNLARLVLYEPPIWRDGQESAPDAVLDRMDDLAAAGENEAVLETFFEDVAGEPERFERLRGHPGYDRHVAAASTLPREVRGRESYQPTPETYPGVDVPVLLLTGTESSDALSESTRRARAFFEESALVELEGQGHAAMRTAPDRFVETVTEFVEGVRAPASDRGAT